MDKFLWKVVDFSKIPIKRRGGNYIIKNFCSGFTREISLQAKSMKGDHPKYKMKSRRNGIQGLDQPRTRSKWFQRMLGFNSFIVIYVLWYIRR